MVMALLGAVLVGVFLWSVSVGAIVVVRREDRRGLDGRCPAWVPLPQVDGRLFHCGAPVRAGDDHCPQHASPDRRPWTRRHPDWERVERTRDAADAASKLRWGAPLAIASLLVALVLVAMLAS